MEDKILKQIEDEALKYAESKSSSSVFFETHVKDFTEGAKYGYNIKKSVDVDWKKFRDEYFDEHVQEDTGGYIHVTTAAHDLFEWFKSKLSASKNTVSNEGEWVSVDDRLPEAYETIISYNIHTDEVSTDYIDDEKRWDVLNPTHWMPLPQPPKEK